MLFVMDEILSKHLSQYKPNSSVENIFVEINLQSKQWLLSCSYKLNLTLLNNHIQSISRSLDFYSSKYHNFIFLGDFNAETSNTTFSEFCATYNLKNLITEPRWFKSLENPTCIDLILTNRPKCFQKSNVFEIGLSDFHKLALTVLKAYFQKQKLKLIKIEAIKNLKAICLKMIFWTNYYQKTFKPKILIHLRLLPSIYLTNIHC